MHRIVKFDILKFTLLLLVSLIVVPCSAKREVKLLLNIPLESTNQLDRKTINNRCASFIVSASSSQIDKHDTISIIPSHIFYWSKTQDYSFELSYKTLQSGVDRFFEAIPIYIIHQRYRL